MSSIYIGSFSAPGRPQSDEWIWLFSIHVCLQTDTEKDAILAENPFFHVGELWKSKRARWSIVLTPAKIKGLYGTMEEKTQRMVEYLQNHVRDHPGEPMEARGVWPS